MREDHINQNDLISLFDYSDGKLYWKHLRFGVKANRMAGRLIISTGRIQVTIDKKHYVNARLIFLYHHGYLPKIVDHIDRNPLNDRIENLRAANHSQNNANSRSRYSSTSKYLGVSFCNETKKWAAHINHNRKQKNLGKFILESDAALAYNKSAVKLHKEFANLNIIKP